MLVVRPPPPKVTASVRDVKLPRGMGWLSKLVRKSVKDSMKNQVEKNLKSMVAAKTTMGLLL